MLKGRQAKDYRPSAGGGMEKRHRHRNGKGKCSELWNSHQWQIREDNSECHKKQGQNSGWGHYYNRD